jgi:hypothetical protein
MPWSERGIPAGYVNGAAALSFDVRAVAAVTVL